MLSFSRTVRALIAALALLATLAGAASAQIASDDYTSTEPNRPVTANVLQNDFGIGLTVSAVQTPAHGTATLSADSRSILYTPNAGFEGTEVFEYTASGGGGGTATARLTVVVTGNPAPVAVDDPPQPANGRSYYLFNRDQPAVLSGSTLLQNDSDPNGDPITLTGVANGLHGTATFNGSSITYTPNPGFSGFDRVAYTISDPAGHPGTAYVYLGIRDTSLTGNLPSVAYDDSFEVDQGDTLTVAAPGVLGNDTDPNLDFLNATLVSDAAHGTLTLSFSGSFTYTPDPAFSGADSFTYRANDSNIATVTITVHPVGAAPVASDDSYEIQGAMLTIDAPGVLENDTDADGDTITAVLVSEPAHGTLTLNADGSFNYMPDASFDGSDSFTYQANDGTADSNVATVTIRAPAVNNATDAVDDYVWLRPDRVFIEAIRPRDNDTGANGSRLTITGFTQPTSGKANVTLNPNNTFDYFFYADERSNFTADSFTYTITDENGVSDTATVFITTENNPPVAVDDHAGVGPGRTSTTIVVLGNDFDPDYQFNFLTIQGFTQPAHGTVALVEVPGAFPPQQLVYTPDPGFTGFDEFTYTVLDIDGATDTATVFIEPQNHAPVAVDDPAIGSFGYTVFSQEFVFQDFPNIVFPTSNDYDLDGDPLTITVVTPPAHGTVEIINQFGPRLRYTPEAGYTGPDELTYTISDGQGGADTAAIHLLVASTYPQITTISPNSAVKNGPALTLTVNGLSGESGGRPYGFLPISWVNFGNTRLETTYVSPTQLTAIVPASLLTQPGTVNVSVATPVLPDLSEGWWNSNSVTFTITETPPNRPPDAVNDSAATTWDTGVDIAVLFNDTDPDGDTLTVTAATPGPGTHGTLAILPAGRVRYTPDPGFTGTATFTYTADDGKGGADTATVTVTVNNPVPHLTSLSPNTRMAGGPAFTLTVNGSGFATGSIVRWNGANRPTAYVSPTQLTAEIPASDIAAAGAASVTVLSPAPGGGVSNPLVLTVGTPKLGVSVTLARSGSEVTATLTLRNTGGMTAPNVRLSVATLQRGAASFSGAALPLSFGDIAPGGSAMQTLRFNVGATPGGSASLSLSGVYTGGTFGSTLRTTLP